MIDGIQDYDNCDDDDFPKDDDFVKGFSFQCGYAGAYYSLPKDFAKGIPRWVCIVVFNVPVYSLFF